MLAIHRNEDVALDSSLRRYLEQGIDSLCNDDPAIADLLEAEHQRQMRTLSLVASCGGTHPSVLATTGASIVNVTAEGYPGRRYHAGCTFVDKAERLAIQRACTAFRARFANVQPHCASFANHTVMACFLKPGDPILGLALDQGGHLTHGTSVNLSGRLYDARHYGIDAQGRVDYAQMRDIAHAHRPRMIVCGTTSCTRTIDFDRIREIADEVGALVLADVTHIAGLIVAGLHPSSIDAAHFTTTCTFKQLYGPRGGLILMGRDADRPSDDGKRTLSQRIQSAVFPMMQGSPEVHTIAAKAVALGRTQGPAFAERAERILANARTLATDLVARGYEVIGGGTDNHIVLFRVPEGITGEIAERALESCGILVNKNKIPADARSARTASGIRLGTNTVSLRGMGPAEMHDCAELIDEVVRATTIGADGAFSLDGTTRASVERRVQALCAAHPLPYAAMANA
ncbi:glycine hydroxymethyltransferase (plasmid) [Azospirillum sp. B510]|uniref:serine hydroxymethyltransferase n=1 Tax=Azospirillum sp. (strain B510) TaxID=137722 RepID=UPI0001C4B893|nr:serine hydroxymethyltransferase [Azospirillum sp. B510]BAI74127.1 glycine hydroxymethyltransferase [Azospirillum sp. B510]